MRDVPRVVPDYSCGCRRGTVCFRVCDRDYPIVGRVLSVDYSIVYTIILVLFTSTVPSKSIYERQLLFIAIF